MKIRKGFSPIQSFLIDFGVFKQCTKCGKLKVRIISFHRQSSSPDGRVPSCKSCRKEHNRQYYLDNQEKVSSRNARYKSENREKVSLSNKRYRENNKEVIQGRKRKWDQENRHKNATYSQNRRALEKEAEGSFTEEEWEDLCEYYNNICLRCGKEGKMTVDHIVPLSKGGTNYIENLQPLCKPCNTSKGNRHETDYRY